MSLNSMNLVGRVGGDPNLRHFDSGAVLCRLSLAVDRIRKNDPPDWFNLELWSKEAEVAGNYVRKGGLIAIQGSFKIDTWRDRQTGEQRSSPTVRVNTLKLLGRKQDDVPPSSPYDSF